VIQPAAELSISRINLESLPPADRETAAQQILLQETQQPFDLSAESLFRVTLIQLDADDAILLMVLHHILCDDWSMNLLCQELSVLYNSDNATTALPELRIQYGDFALWQRQWLQAEVLDTQLNYWRQQMADLPKLQLPTDHPRPTYPSERGARQSFQLPQPLTTALMALSRQEGVTLFMTLLAVFQVLLYRYTGQEDVPVASPVANRHHPGIESLIGFFVNIVMLRTNLSGAPSFRELLQRVRRMALDAYHHQDLPFEKLVEALHPERSLNGQPLFDVVFALQNRHFSQPLQLDGLQHQWIEIDNGTAKCDLLLQLIETPEGLTGYFEYCTDLFEAETISRMVGHFQTLLTAIVADANQPITQLSMLTPPELHQLLVTWNNTQTDYPQDRCIHQLFEAQVQHQPDAVAVVFGEEQLTYRQLNRRANQLADYLQSLGVTPEGLVGLCVERSLDMVVGLLAILKAGGAYLPLDPEYPTERLQYMLQDAQVQVLLTQQHLVERLSDYQGQSICLDTDWSVISQCSPENPITAVETSHLAYVIYTSGSTGQPKGVMVSHQALLNLVFWHQQAFEVTAQDKATQLAGTAFDAAGWELWPYLSIGASIDLVPSDIRISPENLQAWLTSQDITISFLPTPVAEQFLSLEWTETTPLRTVLTGGDRLHQYPSRSVPFQVVNNYGPTENTVVTTSGLVAPHQQTNQIPPSIGRPIANIQTYILDSHLQPVPIGVPGELYIGGAGLAQGYLNRPDLTQEKFISNPFNPSKLYKTGDLVRYLPDGNIEFIGRIDNQVKIRGFRIELGEIETVLGQHRGIQAFCVIVREDTPGNKRLVAYIVPKPQMIPSISQLRQFLKAQLPDYMVPSAFVVLESLPLTPNGKVNHRALPAPDFSAHGDHYIAPSTITEAILAQIWSQVLTVKKVGIHNNFFELGGNSLLAARAIARMQDILEMDIPVRYLFEFPTIAQLAEQLDNTQTVETKPATINLNADIVLPLETCPQGIVAPETLSQPNYIFLTGSTGFLGAFLIDELLRKTPATLYCLVRAVDTQQGMKKLQQTLEKYRLWQPGFSHRIIPVAGDLEQPLLGLSIEQFNQLATQIDTIYHSGAQVNFVKPYSVVKVANVLGTQEVIKLAVQSQIKPLHYISTAGVFGPVSYFEDCPILFENEDIGDYEEYVALDLGYSQSKWVAEKLVKIAQSRGLPVTIMRPGFILGHPETGVTHTTDFWSRFIKGCLEMGYFPELVNQAQEFIPINYVSEAIVYLSMQSDSIGKVFHLTPPEQHLTTIELFELIQSLGYPLQSLPYSQWKKRLIQQTKQSPNHALVPLLPIFTEKVYKDLTIMELYQNNPEYDCQNTITGLQGTSIQCPKIDQTLVKTYLSYFMDIGFIEPPITAQVGSI
jgi:amino acid adenylation domain-containing protein/thioester reductase-like protein